MKEARTHKLESIPKWFEIAEGELGVREVRGQRHNPRIIEYLKRTFNIGQRAKERDETAWCAAFVNWCLFQAGIEGTYSALAKSFLTWGRECEPHLGAICILKYENDYDPTTKGGHGWHVGFFVMETPHSYRILGGNQLDQVSYKNFPKRMYSVAGYRVPSET